MSGRVINMLTASMQGGDSRGTTTEREELEEAYEKLRGAMSLSYFYNNSYRLIQIELLIQIRKMKEVICGKQQTDLRQIDKKSRSSRRDAMT